MFKKFIDKAKDLADKAELSSKLQSAIETTKQVASEQYQASKIRASDLMDGNWQKIDEAIATHWPKVESELVRRLVNAAEDKLSRSETVESAFTKSYELLPAPVRLLLSRKNFIDYCMSHRDPLLEKVRKYKMENWASLGYSSQEEANSVVQLSLESESNIEAEIDTVTSQMVSAVPSAMKVCPMCAEDIKAAAIVCRYCGHKFSEQTT